MDGSHFDTLTKRLTAAGSRRRALAGLLIGTLGFLSIPAHEAAAKNCKKIQNKAKRKKCLAKVKALACPAGQKPCRGSCISLLICCDDTDCPGGKTCQNGSCACPAGTKLCPDQVCRQCCESKECWINGADQGDGRQCQGGVCVCSVGGTRLCPNGFCGSCCADSECRGGQVCVKNNPGASHLHCACYYMSPSNCDCLGTCIPNACAAACNKSCPLNGPCCSAAPNALTCQFANENDFVCRPP
jgi:hypothetical protein